MRLSVIASVATVLLQFTSFNSYAFNSGDQICFDNDHRELSIMNEQVISWKKTTPNQYLARAYIQGVVVLVPAPGTDRDHSHFVVDLDGNSATLDDQIEAVFNNEFGELNSAITTGSTVEICGDYITSNARTSRYQPSPQGAIIHWLHYNPGNRNGGKHKDGFVTINGKVIGANPK